MEFAFDIGNLFDDDIFLVDKNLIPANRTRGNLREYRAQLSTVLDVMGNASAKAQGLHATITTGNRLSQSEHVVYIKADRRANNGRGAVIGFLKVGSKKLFTYDPQGRHYEVEPLCVLDFYVHESCQRQGAGKTLFDTMLQRERIEPHQLAIDRPSPKLVAFLSKHYGLRAAIPQVNNFVVYDGFFSFAGKSLRRKPVPIVYGAPTQDVSGQGGPSTQLEDTTPLINGATAARGQPLPGTPLPTSHSSDTLPQHDGQWESLKGSLPMERNSSLPHLPLGAPVQPGGGRVDPELPLGAPVQSAGGRVDPEGRVGAERHGQPGVGPVQPSLMPSHSDGRQASLMLQQGGGGLVGMDGRDSRAPSGTLPPATTESSWMSRPPSGSRQRERTQNNLRMGAYQTMYSRHYPDEASRPVYTPLEPLRLPSSASSLGRASSLSGGPLLRNRDVAKNYRPLDNASYLDRRGHLALGPATADTSSNAKLMPRYDSRENSFTGSDSRRQPVNEGSKENAFVNQTRAGLQLNTTQQPADSERRRDTTAERIFGVGSAAAGSKSNQRTALW